MHVVESAEVCGGVDRFPDAVFCPQCPSALAVSSSPPEQFTLQEQTSGVCVSFPHISTACKCTALAALRPLPALSASGDPSLLASEELPHSFLSVASAWGALVPLASPLLRNI